MQERLQKLISQAGLASRRAAEEIILAGRVMVNGVVITELGSKADASVDSITVDGKPVKPVSSHLYILLNKPAGFMTTLDDPEGRQLVTDLLPEIKERVYPVGRLDYNTEGLLLLTNDGDWANKLMHPRHEIEKEYHIRVRGKVHQSQIDQLQKGVMLDDRPTAPATVLLIKDGEQNDWLSITIHEGRNRQIRRMCEAVSLSVVRLKRVRYGILELGPLKSGQYRNLTEREVRDLLIPGAHKSTGERAKEKRIAGIKREPRAIAGREEKPHTTNRTKRNKP
ncbi:MAG: rRNA pseudouridine synthase [Desulfuromonadales bacterium]|nr:rRNA pseudouridine synthase [Desulfuromonadales bacterium]